jgi:hypothetical protein
MTLTPFALEVTPEWSGVSLASPETIPSGRILARGVPCSHEQRGVTLDGSLNVLGVDGELHLVFDRPGNLRPELELPVQNVRQIQRRGLFRKSLVLTTHTLEEHAFRGGIAEIQQLCEWAKFATRKSN